MSVPSIAVNSAASTQEDFMNQLPAPVRRVLETIQNPVVKIPLSGAIHVGSAALAAGLFTAVSPLGGAIFGISGFATGQVVSWLSDKFNCCPDSSIANIAKVALSLVASIGAGYAALTLAGLPITIGSALAIGVGGLAISMVVIVPVVVTGTLAAFAYKVYELAQQRIAENNAL